LETVPHENDLDYIRLVKSLADRARDGVITFSLLESNEECRRKIACNIGQSLAFQSMDKRHQAEILSVLSQFLPPRLATFAEYLENIFFKNEGKSKNLPEDQNLQCEKLECKMCYSL